MGSAARTPKGTEVRTVIKHVTKRIVWRGDLTFRWTKSALAANA
jgi:hypothetical protein